MAFSITLSDAEWGLVADLFEPPGRRGAPARIERRAMVDAMLFLARTGCQWRYLPAQYPPWGAVWQQWRRWRANGVWERAMARLGGLIRWLHGREPLPSMVIIDAQTVKGGRYGPTYHEPGGRGGRTIGAKRTVLVEILGLPVAAHVESARPHDVVAGRALIHEALPHQPRVSDVLGDRGYRALVKAAEQHGVRLVIKAHPPARRASGRSPRCTRSSTPSPSSGAGAASLAASRARRRVPGPGLRSPAWAICSAGSRQAATAPAGHRPRRPSR